jgi:hypothetical protein
LAGSPDVDPVLGLGGEAECDPAGDERDAHRPRVVQVRNEPARDIPLERPGDPVATLIARCLRPPDDLGIGGDERVCDAVRFIRDLISTAG